MNSGSWSISFSVIDWHRPPTTERKIDVALTEKSLGTPAVNHLWWYSARTVLPSYYTGSCLQEAGMLSPSFLYMAEPAHQRVLSLSTEQTTHTLFAQKHNKETTLKDISPACRFLTHLRSSGMRGHHEQHGGHRQVWCNRTGSSWVWRCSFLCAAIKLQCWPYFSVLASSPPHTNIYSHTHKHCICV